jgi:hypothetical protein
MAGVDMAQGHEKCTRQLAQNAKRNAKFLLSLGKTVRFIVRIVFQNARTTAAKKKQGLFISGSGRTVSSRVSSGRVRPLPS